MRVSALPSFLACPSSELPTENPYDPTSEVADLGNAVHFSLAAHVMGRVPDLGAIAKKYDVDPDELERLHAYGCLAWNQIGKYFPNARVEEVLEGDGIRGHADVFHRDDVTMCVADWKSGRIRRNYRPQVLGYAAAAVHQFGMPESGEVSVCIVWLRFFEYEVFTFTQADMDGLHDDIQSAHLDIGKRYAPGDPCSYCRRQLVCGARHEYLASATSALLPVVETPLSPDQLPLLYTKAKQLRKALKAYDQALKMALESGPLPDGEGGLLELVETNTDRIIPREAWPILTEAAEFTEDEMAGCLSMKKGAILDVIAGRSAKGKKGKDRAAFMEVLQQGGAVTKIPGQTVRVNKASKATLEEMFPKTMARLDQMKQENSNG